MRHARGMTISKPGVTLANDRDLWEHWTSLVGRRGFTCRSVWMILVENDRTVAPVVVPIDEVPEEPDDDTVDSLRHLVDQARRQLGVASTPMLISRPGSDEMTEEDRRWARALRVVVSGQAMQWPIHLAGDGPVRVFAPDDLIG